MALTLTSFPKDLHRCIVDALCNTFLPIALYSERTSDTFAMNSIPSIIMLVLQHANDTGRPPHHLTTSPRPPTALTPFPFLPFSLSPI